MQCLQGRLRLRAAQIEAIEPTAKLGCRNPTTARFHSPPAVSLTYGLKYKQPAGECKTPLAVITIFPAGENTGGPPVPRAIARRNP